MMKKGNMFRNSFLGVIVLGLTAATANAEPPQAPDQAEMPSRPTPPVDPRYVDAPRAAAPSLALALEAATTAVEACKKMNYRPTVQVTDAAGEIVVLLSGDGAGLRSLRLMKPKPYSVYRHKLASSRAVELAKNDPVLAEAISEDVGKGYGGALPILVGDELIGVITVSGAANGNLDEACGKAGLDRIALRLKRDWRATAAGR